VEFPGEPLSLPGAGEQRDNISKPILFSRLPKTRFDSVWNLRAAFLLAGLKKILYEIGKIW